MTDPVFELAVIQGPVRHVWWSFWVGVGGRCLRYAIDHGGPWSFPWVVGNLASSIARLERWTR